MTSKKVELPWIDDKIQLLFDATLKLKIEEDYEGMNWESKTNNDERTTEFLLEQYPRYFLVVKMLMKLYRKNRTKSRTQ